MTDVNELQNAGHSSTSRAWYTNPARRSLLAVARPYLNYVVTAIARLEDRTRALEERAGAAGQRQQEVAPSGAFRDEVLDLTRSLDGLRKDQLAVNHRLGGLEDEISRRSLDAGQQHEAHQLLSAEVQALRQALAESGERGEEKQAFQRLSAELEAIRQALAESEARREEHQTTAMAMAARAGIATLQRNVPMAIRGTSLVLHDGPYGRFLLRQPDLIADHILGGAFWDAHLKPVIERAASAGRSAIDAGAYIGFHTVFMSAHFRTVHAFEPQVEIYRTLCANLLLNACRNVVAHNAALYDVASLMRLAGREHQEIPVPQRDGTVDYDRVANAAALTFELVKDATDDTAVRALTVDDLALRDVGFMKVDTQGSDLHVLRGARDTLQRCRPVVTFEFEQELSKLHATGLEDYRSFLDDLGYDLDVLDDRQNGKQVDFLATPRPT